MRIKYLVGVAVAAVASYPSLKRTAKGDRDSREKLGKRMNSKRKHIADARSFFLFGLV